MLLATEAQMDVLDFGNTLENTDQPPAACLMNI